MYLCELEKRRKERERERDFFSNIIRARLSLQHRQFQFFASLSPQGIIDVSQERQKKNTVNMEAPVGMTRLSPYHRATAHSQLPAN